MRTAYAHELAREFNREALKEIRQEMDRFAAFIQEEERAARKNPDALDDAALRADAAIFTRVADALQNFLDASVEEADIK